MCAVFRIAIAIVLALTLAPSTRAAETTAGEILAKVRELDATTRKWSDRVQAMTLRIHGKGGGDRERTLRMYDKQAAGGEDKTITFFLSPAEVKDTAFLQLSHADRDADQWLYLPELGRTRRITSNLRDQSFMGTDFSYRDLEILGSIQGWTDKEAKSELTGEEEIDGRACHVVALTPQQAGMSYGKIVVWVDKESLVLRQMRFHGADGKHVKTLIQSEVRDVGSIPTAHRLEMQNVEKGSRTEVELTEVKYNVDLSDDLFSERQLKKGAPRP